MGVAAQRMLRDMRGDIFAHLQRLAMPFFSKQGTGDLMSRLVNDTEAVGQLFGQGLAQSLGPLFGLVGVIIGMFALSWQLALATFTVLPVMVVLTIWFSRRARIAYRLTRETIGDLSAELGGRVRHGPRDPSVLRPRHLQRSALQGDQRRKPRCEYPRGAHHHRLLPGDHAALYGGDGHRRGRRWLLSLSSRRHGGGGGGFF